MSRCGASLRTSARRGFTLLEVLLATMLAGVMAALCTLTFQSVVRGWQVSSDYLDRMQRSDYALEQVVSGLRSAYYPHGGGQNADYGFALENRGDGSSPDRSDVVTWSKTGPAIVGTKNAVADTVHRVQLLVLEEGDGDYAEPIRKTGLYARVCRDVALMPTSGRSSGSASGTDDYTLGNPDLYQPILVADGVTGFNCRVMATKDGKGGDAAEKGKNDKKAFEDEFSASNAVPYKVELTLFVEKANDRGFLSRRDRAPLVRVVRLPIYEQSLDGAATPNASKDGQGGRGGKSKGGGSASSGGGGAK